MRGELRNWYTIDLTRNIIYAGNVYGHHKYRDGAKMYTGVIASVDETYKNEPEGFIILTTHGGSRFICKMSEAFKKEKK